MQMPVKISSTKSRVFIPTIKVIILELMCICANCICCVNSLQEIAIVYHPQPSARDKFLFLGNAPNQGVQGYDIPMCQLDNLMKRFFSIYSLLLVMSESCHMTEAVL